MSTQWDYSSHAAHYDKRADYSGAAIDTLVQRSGARPGSPVAEIGAGTGKLTKELLKRGLTVHAVEPNANMRARGISNTQGQSVKWHEAFAEATGLETGAYGLVAFGSSFNVTDWSAALRESARLLTNRGWFACMWNHRHLDEPLQAAVEQVIRAEIPEYDYGSRREDQRGTIEASALFENVSYDEHAFTVETSAADYLDAWRSHATLSRQAADRLASILDKIQGLLAGRDTLSVPYRTVMWMAQRR